MHSRGHAWQGVCVWQGHVWWGICRVCMAEVCVVEGAHGRGGVCGREACLAGEGLVLGACMAGVCMAGVTHGGEACMACSGWYASY